MAEYMDLDPQLGEWYLDPEDDLRFQVVAIDEDNDTIEIQYDDGDVDELDFNSWYASAYELAAAPDDLSEQYGRLEEGDAGYAEPNSGERRPNIPR
ncbi:MAG TPA: DUF6763 family protein [Gammaproteobacteria bacterium]|jgi:hypothetical protein